MTTELSQDTAAEETVVSPLSMSDEEVMNLDFSTLEGTPEPEPEVEAEAEPEASQEEEEEPKAVEEETTEEKAEPEQEEESDDEVTEEEPTEETSEEDSQEEESDDDETVESETSDIDYKAEYERILGPIKANGQELKVDSVDDAIRLMQMGANYNKKMASLKPALKTMKLLENNKLLDENKLNYLIDLDKKNPEAIKKLIKESGIDPMDIDTDSESEYKPNTYTVDDRELAVDEVLETIKDTPTYEKTIDVVSNKWDVTSKQTIADNPNLLEVINAHMASGVYDLVSKEVEKERMFGRLTGMSDLEAYKATGDALDAKGAFDHLKETPQRQEPTKKTITKNKPVEKSSKTVSKKRAASSTIKSAPAKAPTPNVLNMSDEEFEKEIFSQYL